MITPIPIDERFISTQEASEILQIDEQVLRKLGQLGCRGIYKIGKQYRFRLKEFETVSAELSENLDRLSQEVKSLEEDYREKVDRFGLSTRLRNKHRRSSIRCSEHWRL